MFKGVFVSIMDLMAYKVLEGCSYYAPFEFTAVPSGETRNILIRNPSGSGRSTLFVGYEVFATGRAKAYGYVNVTVSTLGDEVTLINRRTSQPKQPKCEVYVNSVLSNLQNPRPFYIPSTTGVKGTGNSMSLTLPIILLIEEGDNVAITFTNADTVDIDIGGAIWLAESPDGIL